MTTTYEAVVIRNLSASFDVFSSSAEMETEENRVIEFPEDALAIVSAMKNSALSGYDIYDFLARVSFEDEDDKTTVHKIEITDFDREQAEAIYKHFNNKFMMMRLNGDHISNFQMTVEHLCTDSRRKVKVKELAPLISLHKFYQEDLVLDNLLNGRKSLPKIGLHDNLNTTIEVELEFVGKLEQVRKKGTAHNYFWTDDKNNLYRLNLHRQDTGIEVWNYLSTFVKKIKVEGNARIKKIEGTRFYCYEMYPLGTKLLPTK